MVVQQAEWEWKNMSIIDVAPLDVLVWISTYQKMSDIKETLNLTANGGYVINIIEFFHTIVFFSFNMNMSYSNSFPGQLDGCVLVSFVKCARSSASELMSVICTDLICWKGLHLWNVL